MPADIALLVDNDGEVGLAPWRAVVLRGVSGPASGWWRLLLKALPLAAQGNVSLSAMLEATVAQTTTVSLFGQLVWQTSYMLERACYVALRKGPVHDDGVQVKSCDIMQVIERPLRLNNELLRVVLSGVAASEGHRNISIACDKANVGGLSLQSGVVVLETNQALLAPPQARRCTICGM